MTRPVKWLLGGVGAVAAVALAGLLAIALLLEPARVRDQLVSLVRSQTGHHLEIARPVRSGLFPWLGVSLRELRLDDAHGFGGEPLARADELSVRVRVLPLLAGRLEMSAFVLKGLDLNLVRNAKGETNWGAARGRGPAPSGGGAAHDPAGVPGGLAALLLGGVELTGGRVTWQDHRARTHHLFEDLELHLGAFASDRPIPIRFGTRVRAEQPRREIVVAGSGNLRLGEPLTTVQIPDLELKVTAAGEGLPAGGLNVAARTGVLYDVDGGTLTLDDLNLTLDGTAVRGRLAVSDFAAPALQFDLAADRLDLDHYAATPGQAEPLPSATARPQTAGALVAAAAALPAATWQGVILDGGLAVGAIKAGGARLSGFRARWRARDGVVTQTAEAELYGGSARSMSMLDVTGAQPTMTLKGDLQGVDVQGLLQDTTGRRRLSGTGTLEADLRWAGASAADIKRTLNGTARLALRDGAIQGFDLDALVQNALAVLRGVKGNATEIQTPFSALTASLTAVDGVLSNTDLQGTSAFLGIAGAGTIDLPAHRIDYLAKATVLESAEGRVPARLRDLRGIPIPVRFAGRLDAPTIRLDLDEALKGATRQQIERRVEEKLKGEWGDKLKRFLGR